MVVVLFKERACLGALLGLLSARVRVEFPPDYTTATASLVSIVRYLNLVATVSIHRSNMVLKRKRSESEFSSSSSLFSSPQSGALHAPLHNEYTVTPVPTPLQLSSRTRKRYRNNRPSESEVHREYLNSNSSW